MTRLGDHFPPGQRRTYVARHLVPGQVLYLFCDFTTPPKDKYLVVACAGTEPLLFVINTSVHPYIQKRPELRRCQVQLRASDHPFLRHDSVINCAEAVRGSDLPDMEEQRHSETTKMGGIA